MSNNDGCVVARSNEAKALGVAMGMPYFQMKKQFKNVIAYSSNYTLYGDMSRRVMNILSEYTPNIEVYSIDEAFLDLSGFKKDTMTDYIKDIKHQVYKQTGIPVSIGVGGTKVLAKAFNKISKKQKDGVLFLTDEMEINTYLKKYPVDDLWGVGLKSQAKLKNIGIHTAYDLKTYNNEKQILKLLTKTGRQIQDELKGISCINLELETKNKKQIVSSKSFGRNILIKSEIREALSSHITRAAEKLRRQNSTCQNIIIFIHTNRFKNTPQTYDSVQYHFLSPTASTFRMINIAIQMLDQIFKPGFEYKKCGVILSDIYQQNESQFDLFDQNDSVKEIQILKSMDDYNRISGPETIKIASCGINKHWKMMSQMKSKAFTTRVHELLKVENSQN